MFDEVIFSFRVGQFNSMLDSLLLIGCHCFRIELMVVNYVDPSSVSIVFSFQLYEVIIHHHECILSCFFYFASHHLTVRAYGNTLIPNERIRQLDFIVIS